MVVLIIIGLSITLQVSATVLALRLIRVTGSSPVWIFMAVATLLMAVRRSITFLGLLSGSLATPPDLATELLALLISMCMVAGIAYIAPLFLSIQRAEAARQRSEAELRKQQEEYQTIF